MCPDSPIPPTTPPTWRPVALGRLGFRVSTLPEAGREQTLAVATGATVDAERRAALVIGNGNYAHVPRLANPANDAADMAAALGRLGFRVSTLPEAGREQMLDGLKQFSRTAQVADIAVIFFAGHGIEVDRANYLVPVDAELAADTDVAFEAVPLGLVTEAVSGAKSFGLVILDACRDNPFRRRMERAGATRSIGRGLGRVEPTGGSVAVAYAARDGTTAADGDGRNSPYTRALLQHIAEPELVSEIFNKVAENVLAQTNSGQEPVVYGRLPTGAYFNQSGDRPAWRPALVEALPDPAAEAWKVVRDAQDRSIVQEFLADWPDSNYASAARALLAKLASEAWKVVRDGQDAVAVEKFLTDWPDSGHASAAHALLAQLTPPFTVTTEPSNARVRFLNIAEAYAPGMPLPPGEYQLEVSAVGYQTVAHPVVHQAGAKPSRVVLHKPPEVFRDCDNCPEMVVIPAGRFRMGCVSGLDCGSSEKPVHEVRIGAPFALGRYEVTVAEWNACVSGRGCRGKRKISSRRPVMNVSWDMAQSYVRWLSRKTRESYRLPSESEWEYAARAGTATKYSWGNEVGRNRANCDGCGSRWDDEQTAPVGSFAPNGFGLHDMHGNAWEWVEDCSNVGYAGAPADGSAWLRGDCAFRVLRGGSWVSYPGVLRAASRIRIATGSRSIINGFRVARTLTP